MLVELKNYIRIQNKINLLIPDDILAALLLGTIAIVVGSAFYKLQ